MKIRFAVLALAAIALSGCGAQIAAMHGIPIVAAGVQESVAAETKVEHNPHTGQTIVSGPIIFHDGNLLGNSYLVRSWTAPNNPALDDRFQVYVMANFSSWAFLNQAYAGGEALDTTVIDRQVGSCSQYGCRLTETVGINLPRSRVEALTSSGLSFQIRGQRNNITMFVPGPYFAAVLEAHNQARSGS